VPVGEGGQCNRVYQQSHRHQSAKCRQDARARRESGQPYGETAAAESESQKL